LKPLISCEEAAALDERTRREAAIPALVLMEDAALKLWLRLGPIAERLGAGRVSDLVGLCGSGNNAGDCLALLRQARFSGDLRLVAILARDDLGELGALHLGSLEALGVPVLRWSADPEACRAKIAGAGLLVDGIAGTGLLGAMRGPAAELAMAANASGRPIASIDLPSGLRDGCLEDDPMVEATWTLSLEPAKAPLYYPSKRLACGEILAIDGVFPRDFVPPAAVELLEAGDLSDLVPRVPVDAYKGRRGRLAVFAGSVGASGAAVLAARASLAAGAGLSTVFAHADVLPILATFLEAVMVKPEPLVPGAIDPDGWDAFLAGPGWGRSAGNRLALARLLSTGIPAVLDADAIHLFKELLAEGFRPKGTIVLTPHPGEFASLRGISAEAALANPRHTLNDAAAETGTIIVLKSHVTWIASPGGRLAAWEGLESGLGTAGSGDVLAGTLAGLLASAASLEAMTAEEEAFSAARAAVIAHGIAGKRCREALGWFEAGDLRVEVARLLGRNT
jgi:hydroxyethylthiazole kinase-like uncharacterized protein yjeF